ncbi:DUF6152 family protein [Aestuariivirga sp.]|uniref:DUF6152 family protein n=1 Tax=Aestuariivirga sp. TaxID=2650926 RepID=UPI003018A40E
MKTKLTLAAMAGAMLILGGAPSQAHHAVQASVDVDKTVEVKAILTRIDWINPHTWMHFDVKDAAGKVQKIDVESLGIAALRRVGVDSKSALKVGDTYTIGYYPNRDGSPGGFMAKMVLPDGRTFDTKNTDPAATQ